MEKLHKILDNNLELVSYRPTTFIMKRTSENHNKLQEFARELKPKDDIVRHTYSIAKITIKDLDKFREDSLEKNKGKILSPEDTALLGLISEKRIVIEKFLQAVREYNGIINKILYYHEDNKEADFFFKVRGFPDTLPVIIKTADIDIL